MKTPPICRAVLLTTVALLSSCAGDRPPAPAMNAAQARGFIDRVLPHPLADREGWVNDLYAGFTVQSLPADRGNVCAVVAVIEQESGFRIDPVVPGLTAIAWREIDARAAQAGIPVLVVNGVLNLKSRTGSSYAERIDGAKTEKQLSDVYEDLIGAVPLGPRLFADKNPIRTRGPMQVHVAFAQAYASARPYPYPVANSVADEVFTRRGGLYFGIAHLLAYSAAYDDFIFRFADFNAGQYASRNAAFQRALTAASGIALVPDGALLPHEADPKGAGDTELAVRALAGRLNIREGEIHAALQQGKTREFEHTPVYQRVFTFADQAAGRSVARAVIPRINLTGPKISRALTTEWYAKRVDDRFRRCLTRGAR